ncbi:LacI family DNA-binding transcriptional regulator [Yinghuangia soli]|uniref:LacI family transcriptional regulator n=1 Tax=Yinghuangia soli TaxID=2908204 RepID=A0AA41U0Y0_9ACTN|nr:LacI family DNA-binding transcriptional regulator [Yinghuangia soli]MCF2526907.1 LacI family transcriptional regulator [Yinghuangia soli]
MRTRLADIAAQAGVSEATVSRVLNSRPGVADDTRRAVLTALDVLGYERPARLRRRSAGLVGLMLPELDNPIFPAFAQVIERALAHHGYTPVLCTQTPGGATEDDYTELLLERGVSGIIFVSGLHSDSGADLARYVRLVDRGLPVVFVNGFAEGIDAPFISSDESVAVELAIGHLASLRHRRIGLAVGPERYVPTARKIAGFRRGLKATFGVDDAEPWIERSLFSVEGGQAAAGALLDRGATAVVCGSDLMALGVIRAVRERGLTVPGDVSVVGYDDSPLVAFTDPPLTTVRQAVAPMGAAAVRALLDEIGGGRAPRTELVYRPELVVRGSTGPAAHEPAAAHEPPASGAAAGFGADGYDAAPGIPGPARTESFPIRSEPIPS